MKKILVAIILALIVMSCKTTRVVEQIPVETIKTEYITSHTYDSIYIRDSINRWVSGDTVYLYKNKTTYKYKDRVDTLIVRDTIPRIVKVESIREIKVNEIYWWQKTLMWLGGVLSLLSIMLVIHKFK